MKRYETIVIADPEVSEENRIALFERYEGIVSQGGGLLVEIDTWGTRPLAYEIKKKGRGFYFRLDYCGLGALVDEIERFSRIDERILKYLTVMTDPEADPDQIRAEMDRKKEAQQAEKAEAAASEATEESAEPAPSETSEPAIAGETESSGETPSKE
ncbi:MAG: 30S ribosomal protein S6 [Deltaproteobacteria bacterium]|nr:30S ribosomal protein S6 [Deltaproteobacteria bacterium]